MKYPSQKVTIAQDSEIRFSEQFSENRSTVTLYRKITNDTMHISPKKTAGNFRFFPLIPQQRPLGTLYLFDNNSYSNIQICNLKIP